MKHKRKCKCLIISEKYNPRWKRRKSIIRLSILILYKNFFFILGKTILLRNIIFFFNLKLFSVRSIYKYVYKIHVGYIYTRIVVVFSDKSKIDDEIPSKIHCFVCIYISFKYFFLFFNFYIIITSFYFLLSTEK